MSLYLRLTALTRDRRRNHVFFLPLPPPPGILKGNVGMLAELPGVQKV